MEIVKINNNIIKINNVIYKIVESDKLFDCCYNCALCEECTNHKFSEHTICTEVQYKTNIKAYKIYFAKIIENMEPKEIKITPPEGYEIDEKNSTFNCIKFKLIEKKRWRDDENNKLTGYYVTNNANIYPVNDYDNGYNTKSNFNIFATEKQAKSALAMARISQIMANDKRFGGVITDEEWKQKCIKYVIYRCNNGINFGAYYDLYCFLAFHTKEQCNLFLKENEDLVKDYLMLD